MNPSTPSQPLQGPTTLQLITARHERLQDAAPALLDALQRLLPSAIASRESVASRLAPGPHKDAILSMLDDDIQAAQNAVSAALNPPSIHNIT